MVIPKQNRNGLTCKDCNQMLPLTSFITRGRNAKSGLTQYDSRCRKCSAKHQRENWDSYTIEYNEEKAEKIRLIEDVKVKCVVCGYDKCKTALDCHHVDRYTKKFGISDSVRKGIGTIDELKEELQKCVVVCCRCHREHHAGLLDLNGYETIG